MTQQNYEACTVGVKMATIKGRSLAWEKDQRGSGQKSPENPGKGLDHLKESLFSSKPKEI